MRTGIVCLIAIAHGLGDDAHTAQMISGYLRVPKIGHWQGTTQTCQFEKVIIGKQ